MPNQWERDNQRENWRDYAEKERDRGRTDKAARYERRIEQSRASEPQFTGGGGGGAPSSGGCAVLILALTSLPAAGAVASYYA